MHNNAKKRNVARNAHIITDVIPGSIGEQLGLEAGDILLAINGQTIVDRIDYEYACADETICLLVENKHNGKRISIELEKDEGESLGLLFANGLMDKQRCCANHCLFCFVDQMRPGLRDTLYIKDDDWRSSFLAGNYVTLTNVGDRELQRIIDRRVAPLYISVQATEPALRQKLLGNRNAGCLLEQLTKLKDAGLSFHAQVVLCPGINDEKILDNTLADLWALFPAALSCAVVPVGLTKFRDHLPPIGLYDARSANAVIDQIEGWQKRCQSEAATNFVYASDEFYMTAQKSLPLETSYEGYPQIENGVGMLRKFSDELDRAIAQAEWAIPALTAKGKRCTLATGVSAQIWLQIQAEKAARYTGASVETVAVVNHFFGESVTVAGLVTGQDLLATLQKRDLGDAVLIPANMLRDGENVFLDGMRLETLQDALGLPVLPVPVQGEAFLATIASMRQYAASEK